MARPPTMPEIIVATRVLATPTSARRAVARWAPAGDACSLRPPVPLRACHAPCLPTAARVAPVAPFHRSHVPLFPGTRLDPRGDRCPRARRIPGALRAPCRLRSGPDTRRATEGHGARQALRCCGAPPDGRECAANAAGRRRLIIAPLTFAPIPLRASSAVCSVASPPGLPRLNPLAPPAPWQPVYAAPSPPTLHARRPTMRNAVFMCPFGPPLRNATASRLVTSAPLTISPR